MLPKLGERHDAGGKANALGKLAAHGVPVPPGYIIPYDFLVELIKRNGKYDDFIAATQGERMLYRAAAAPWRLGEHRLNEFKMREIVFVGDAEYVERMLGKAKVYACRKNSGLGSICGRIWRGGARFNQPGCEDIHSRPPESAVYSSWEVSTMALLGSRILVAYDHSELSRKALETAVRIAGQDPGVKLHIVHVIEPLNVPVPVYGTGIDNLWKWRRDQAENIMAEVKESLRTLPNDVTIHIEDGSPGERVMNTAHEQQCDLIIMGSRGLTGIKEFFLGSVSHYVVQRSSCPVLIVK